ncbi:MAG TPA: thiamine pyrophosphate-binding protein [Allosphingosinicella sp.]
MRIHEAIVKGLESIGVEAAFGGAGENAAGMMLALDASKKIKGIITRHEQGASFMACGYAMYTNKLGVCWATAGPGAFNFFNGLAMAMSDSYPILAITGYANQEWEGKGSLNETSGKSNTPDSRAMFKACTKGSWHLDKIEDTMDVLEDALNCAYRGRPGPVHISISGDLTHKGQEVTNYRDPRLVIEPVLPDPAEVEAIAEALADAFKKGKSVIALVGFGAIQSGANAAVKQLIERFQIPLVTTLDGKGIVAESHPLSIGVFADSGHASAAKAFMEADVVLAIGNAFNQHATYNYWEGLFDGKKLIHVNISDGEIDKVYKTDHKLVSDARLGIEAISAALEPKVGARPPVTVDNRDYESRNILKVPFTFHPGKMAQIVGRMLPPNAILMADAGAHLGWLAYYVDLEEGQNFRKPGEFGPMAGHTNGAIGVKVANPDRTVVVGCGDGCYSLAGFELMTAVEHDIPVIWIIFNDGQFKLIKLYQLSEYQKTGLVEFQNPDFAAHARACGANGYTVESEDEFEAAFADALASNRPCVIDAKITRLAVPHYSISPEGMLAGIADRVKARLRGE